MLGFYAGVLVILEAGVVAALLVLGSNDDLHSLVPWVLGFGAFTLIGVIVVVVVVNLIDPTKLQLGRVTGKEFLDYQRVRGDSIGGEYLEPAPTTATLNANSMKAALPEPPENAEGGDVLEPGDGEGAGDG